MARTAAGTALTVDHRRAQLQISAATLRDFMRIWPLWDGSEGSFRRLIDASVPLARSYHRLSSSVSASYYEAFRRAERVGGAATPRLAELDTDKLAAGLYVTGSQMTRDALLAGQSPQATMQNALVRTSGSLTRQVLNGGRGTIVQSTAADKQAQGWARVTAGNPCGFCATIAANGPVYSEDTADFEAHDHCSCVGEPQYEGSEWPGRGREFQRLYNEVAKGSENPINEMRKALSA